MFVRTPSVLAYHQISIQRPQLAGRGQAPLSRVGFLDGSAWEDDGEASHMIAFPSPLQVASPAIAPKNLPVKGQAPPLHLDFRISLECLYVGACPRPGTAC